MSCCGIGRLVVVIVLMKGTSVGRLITTQEYLFFDRAILHVSVGRLRKAIIKIKYAK